MSSFSPAARDYRDANQRVAAEARAALDALLARATGDGEAFFGRIAIEISVQNGQLGHIRETTERTRK